MEKGIIEEQVILVNRQDEETGVAEKMKAHQQGWLHRAFSIFVFNSRGEMLLQQRALGKYHSGGLWTNTCCSHPRPGEDTKAAAERRLKEEMGFRVSLEKVFDFVYKADFENGLTEHEFDHVFVAEYEGPVDFNKEEVMNCSYRSMQQIAQSLETDPAQYTAWFRLAFPRVQSWWNRQYKNSIA
ncbi:MAG TPA: isopentenyl-diphosphate Delta-isomerase [Chitinophagaceae bacterium]|nr:isopentenyl-diphosphate Delta-isomerase [Chitinophagaceae bacterium]